VKRLVVVIVALVMLSLVGCAVSLGLRPPARDDRRPALHVITRTVGDVKVHALPTGWVRVKKAHRDLTTAPSLRIPAIIVDQEWTPWMPVLSYAIEHLEGVVLVDTGLTEDMLDKAHFACDPGTSFVYDNLLQFHFAPEERIDRRLAEVGLSVDQVTSVVFTHRHADHTDGLRLLPASTRVYVGEGDWPRHNGALVCRWPTGREPIIVANNRERPFGALPASTSLTTDAQVRAVPLPGHSPGHLGVMLQTPSAWFLFAGDAVFDLDQLKNRRIAGISEVPEAAVDALNRIDAQLQFAPTFLLPAHEFEALDRLETGVPTTSPTPH
jgi:N-acyl homoserine lactone hydrolase